MSKQSDFLRKFVKEVELWDEEGYIRTTGEYGTEVRLTLYTQHITAVLDELDRTKAELQRLVSESYAQRW